MAFKETYKRAFNTIINRLFSHPVLVKDDWVFGFNINLNQGDFISLNAAPASDWQFSWVIELNTVEDKILLKSAMTGELCWWSNVGYSLLKKEKIIDKFKWTDRQFAFDDKFCRSIKRNYDFTLCYGGIEFKGFKVTCFLRKRFDLSNNPFIASVTFDDFRKVKASQLDDFYKENSRIISYEYRT